MDSTKFSMGNFLIRFRIFIFISFSAVVMKQYSCAACPTNEETKSFCILLTCVYYNGKFPL